LRVLPGRAIKQCWHAPAMAADRARPAPQAASLAMDKSKPSWRAGCAAALLLAALAGCGQAPLATAPPSTAVLGAAPATVPSDCELRRSQALRAINAARARARQCGDRTMEPAPPLRWNLQLQWAAAAHSRDMARNDYFEHRDPVGDSVRERVRAQSYWWRHVGENIAGGSESVQDAVEAWLESPSHCENLMEPDYVDVALACAERPGTEFEIYWTLVMARR
jgi:uncharacterized protein YkwD